jgi:hypothetical protein
VATVAGGLRRVTSGPAGPPTTDEAKRLRRFVDEAAEWSGNARPVSILPMLQRGAVKRTAEAIGDLVQLPIGVLRHDLKPEASSSAGDGRILDEIRDHARRGQAPAHQTRERVVAHDDRHNCRRSTGRLHASAAQRCSQVESPFH